MKTSPGYATWINAKTENVGKFSASSSKISGIPLKNSE